MTKVKFFLSILLLFSLLPGCKPKVGDRPDIPTSQTKLDHLVIWEVFYTGSWQARTGGSWRASGYADMRPMYIKIFNPTEETKYLDGLGLATSAHLNTAHSEIKLENSDQDFCKTNAAVGEILRFPGSGQEHPIKPGETILVAKIARDFTKDAPSSEDDEEIEKGNPLSLDLSKANFEWFSMPEQFEEDTSKDNPKVPNLERKFFYKEDESKGLNPTNRTLILFEAKDIEYFDKINKNAPEFYKKYTITRYAASNTYDEFWKSPIVPNDWIIDAVNISPINAYKMRNVDEKIDGGWYGVFLREWSVNSMKQKDTGLAIRRKWNGKIYEDTNNSSHDFEVVKASLETAKQGESASTQK